MSTNDDRERRRRRLRQAGIVALGVGGAVSLGHALFPAGSLWPVLHALLPAVVYTAGVRAAGVIRPTRAILVRGLVVVGLVALAFTVINCAADVPVAVRTALNFAVPFGVSLAGSTPKRAARGRLRPHALCALCGPGRAGTDTGAYR